MFTTLLILPCVFAFLASAVARLYVVSDVLFNSACPEVVGASQYRRYIELELPDMFRCLAARLKLSPGRFSANQLSMRVESVLSAWEQSSLFPHDVIANLYAILKNTDNK